MFKMFSALKKDSIGGAGVHVDTALGNGGKPKKKPKPSDKVETVDCTKQDFSISFEITKMDADKQQIFGWASVATINGEAVVDKQGDIIPIDELEKAAYDFLLDGGVMGDMHERVGVGRPIESMVFTKAKCDALGIKMDREGWFVGFQVDSPDVWKSHKEGKRPEFSIGGSGVRQPQ